MPKFAACLVLVAVQCICILGFSSSAFSAALSARTEPLNIVYIEGGTYPFYNSSLLSLIRELEVRGLIANGQVPENLRGDAKALWDWLAKHAGPTPRPCRGNMLTGGLSQHI